MRGQGTNSKIHVNKIQDKYFNFFFSILASVCDEENEEDQLLDANEAFSADSDLEEPESAEDFCTAEQPQQFKVKKNNLTFNSYKKFILFTS